jgi:hypothetical protein
MQHLRVGRLQAGPEGGEIVCSNCMRAKNCRQDLRVGELHTSPDKWGNCSSN